MYSDSICDFRFWEVFHRRKLLSVILKALYQLDKSQKCDIQCHLEMLVCWKSSGTILVGCSNS